MTIDIDAPVFLLGMPRSGTTWLSQIFESSPDFVVRLSPPYAHEFRGQLDDQSQRADWQRVMQGAISSSDRFMTQNWRRDTGELAAFDKKPSDASRLAIKDTRFHGLYLSAMGVLPQAKSIYIVRHPAASLWSWRQCKEFPSDADFSQEWRTGTCRKQDGPGEYWGFDDWMRLTTDYLRRAEREPGRYLVVRYRELIEDAHTVTRRMFGFCGEELQHQTSEFIEKSQNSFDPRPYAVFKNKTDDTQWRRDFPAGILAEIEADLKGTRLEELLK